MKLQRKGGAVVTEGLHWKRVALRQQFRAERQVEALAMPLIDLLRPGIAHHAADIGRPDRVIADFDVTIGMPVDAAAEMMCQHLGAEADAEKRLLLLQRHGEPIDLAPDEIGGVVRAHGAAEGDGAGMAGHGLGQRIAEARATHVERIAALAQGVTEASWSRRLLMQHDQNRRAHGAVMASTTVEPQYPPESDFQAGSRTPAMQRGIALAAAALLALAEIVS